MKTQNFYTGKKRARRKTCNFCRRYEKHTRYCYQFKIEISDVYSARYCKKYSDKRDLVCCAKCSKLSKKNYCYKENEKIPSKQIHKKRQCIFFKENGRKQR